MGEEKSIFKGVMEMQGAIFCPFLCKIEKMRNVFVLQEAIVNTNGCLLLELLPRSFLIYSGAILDLKLGN